MIENDKGITPALITDILKNVKLNNEITDSSKDNLLTSYINAICNNILIKTNRRVFIPELKYIVIDLVSDKFNSNLKVNPDVDKNIKSMSEYDRSVTFGASDITQSKLNLIAKKQLEENEQLINRYKLLYRS